MTNQKLRFFGFLGSFLLKPDFFHFLELERFLKSFYILFYTIRVCLSVTLLAHFNKDWLIF
ncbi:hypothetical protein [Helicobacter pylori]|uniref:hypothetical protein n=1 Tax=Helicobacter pylori TaxID=210 RepID=UPI001FD27303|nr:hypothetical protein [Helicobacter pylori]